MPQFEVEFVDGKKLVVDTATPEQAKAQTRNTRRGQLPPDTPRSAAEVKIKRVTPLDDEAPKSRRSKKDEE